MRADLMSWRNETKWAEYDFFNVDDAEENYRLLISRYNSNSTAPDELYFNNNQQFTTTYRDNDRYPYANCADHYAGGGWWFNRCSLVFPTSWMGEDGDSGDPYVYWYGAFEGDRFQALKSITFNLKRANYQHQ